MRKGLTLPHLFGRSQGAKIKVLIVKTQRSLEDNGTKTVPWKYSKTFMRFHDGGPTEAQGRSSSKEHIRSCKAKLVQMSGRQYLNTGDNVERYLHMATHRQMFLLQQKEK